MELLSGMNQDAGQPLRTSFTQSNSIDSIVVFHDIPFYSLCEHHLMPFFGTASIAYRPSGHVAGLSKIVRCLRILSSRPQLQERLCADLADTISRELSPIGVAIKLSSRHLCMEMRGIRTQSGTVSTTALRGSFLESRESLDALFTSGFSHG
jgi:GTP cyclohydrolase I